jgi:hypothetical protein
LWVYLTRGYAGMGSIHPHLYPPYPMGIGFCPITYPWVENSSHTRALYRVIPVGYSGFGYSLPSLVYMLTHHSPFIHLLPRSALAAYYILRVYGSVQMAYNPYFLTYFFSRNNIFLSRKISRNNFQLVFQYKRTGPMINYSPSSIPAS